MIELSARSGLVSTFYEMEVFKWATELEEAGRSIIHMEIGLPLFPTPKTFIDAAIDSLKAGETRYTPASGTSCCKDTIAQLFKRDYDIDIDPSRVVPRRVTRVATQGQRPHCPRRTLIRRIG